MRARTILTVFLAALIVAALAALYLLRAPAETFPVIAQGSYIGGLDGPIKDSEGRTLMFFAEGSGAGNHTFVSMVAPDWERKLIIYDSGTQDSHPAVEISGPSGTFILSGEQSGNLSYQGKITEKGGQREGSWRLVRMGDFQSIKTDSEVQALRARLELRAKIRTIDREIKLAEVAVSQQKSEIAKLQHYITEGESLRRNADKKYKDARDELYKLEEQVAAKKREANGLVQKLELSQRLTGMGKLVSLARESLERENRWVESMLKTSVSDTSLELEAAVEKGERILALKNEIALEQERIFRLNAGTK
ncbi:MAG: hypothetical protein J5J00_07285 [Deltaproteobacteria bacterium]|nr:hypothetical protein [Deltaproteobacteria bacterium]